jgi:acyl-CoA reductase-like NAD-dependent aldehyde dehydrogenase
LAREQCARRGARLLNKVADKLEANLEPLALVETLDNGKPIRETTHADMPLVVDHWRYCASVIRAPRLRDFRRSTRMCTLPRPQSGVHRRRSRAARSPRTAGTRCLISSQARSQH